MARINCIRIARIISLVGLIAVLPPLTGCGSKTYPVDGQVVFEDGAPARELAGYYIMFQAEDGKTGATGLIKPDGSFSVGTFNEGDGALRGKQRVAIAPPAPEVHKPRLPLSIPARYGDFNTSELEVEIKPQSNQLKIQVERLKNGRASKPQQAQ